MRSPTVSIGLPVYNGERFLDRAVGTILAQDLGDLELVISDNGSTDGTEELCRSWAAADRRVRYHRYDRNRGAAWNYTHLLDLVDPGARYVKWVAADDEHAPAYLSRTVALLDADPTAALAHTGSADIDEEGYVLKVWHQPVRRLASADPAERLRDLVTLNHECFGAFGLIRAEVAHQTSGLGAFSDADNVLLVEIALRGRMLQDDEVLFFRRQHADRSMTAFPDARERVRWFDPDRRPGFTFPAWRVGAELVRAVRDAPLTAAERRRCYRSLGVFVRCNWPGLVKNVVRSTVEAPAVLLERAGDRAPAPAEGAPGSVAAVVEAPPPEPVTVEPPPTLVVAPPVRSGPTFDLPDPPAAAVPMDVVARRDTQPLTADAHR